MFSSCSVPTTSRPALLLPLKPSTSRIICLLLIIVAVQLASVVERCSAASWSYDEHHGDGPSKWKQSYSDCGGQSQSPINIPLATVEQKPELGQITFAKYDQSTGFSAELTNNGHTVQLTPSISLAATITGGSLASEFTLVQFHLHWGSSDSKGSEHLVNQRSYPLEIHFVHRKSIYPNVSAALQPGGLAVLGVFARVDNEHPNEAFYNLTDKFSDIRYVGSGPVTVEPFAMNALLPINTRDYFRYTGSLTTPGCNEVVTWTVFNDTITVSSLQLAALRTLAHNAQGSPDVQLQDNYRPVQPLNGRTVLSSFNFVAPPAPTKKSTSAAPAGIHNVGRLIPVAAAALFTVLAVLCFI